MPLDQSPSPESFTLPGSTPNDLPSHPSRPLPRSSSGTPKKDSLYLRRPPNLVHDYTNTVVLLSSTTRISDCVHRNVMDEVMDQREVLTDLAVSTVAWGQRQWRTRDDALSMVPRDTEAKVRVV